MERITKLIRDRGTFYPEPHLLFRAFQLCPLETVKVVIVGSLPYNHEDDASGLAFSTPPHRRAQLPVQGIYKELKRMNPEFEVPFHGCLESWCAQGVLLLNSCLTYFPDDPLSATEKKLFMPFMRYVVDAINTVNPDCVYLLWGDDAKHFQNLAKGRKVLTSIYPNPYTGSKFIGCNHFQEANDYLVTKGKKPIDWFNL